jgi:hypothetical protein
MTLSINWLTKVITVPKADLTLLQLNPVEIRELDINAFRLWLKEIEASEEGMPFVDTHYHNPPVTVGGVTLARVVAIINGYTVTFEDGQYAVNFSGANTNVQDVTNVNQVSIRPSNSAGLIQTREIEHASFNGRVCVDVMNGEAGTLYPIGTSNNPVNNLADALLIIAVRWFDTIHVMGNLTIASGDYAGLIFKGESPTKTTITIEAAADVTGCEFENAEVHGVLDGGVHISHCRIDDLTNFNGIAEHSILHGAVPIVLNGNQPTYLLDCHSGVAGAETPTIDMGGSGQELQIRNYNGGIKLINKSGVDKVSIDVNSGHVKLDSSVTNGEILIRGVGKLTDNSDGAAVDATHLVNPLTVADQVVDEDLSEHSPPQSLAATVKRIAGLLGEYRRIKNIARDGNGDVDTAEVHVYENEADYDADQNATVYDADATFVSRLLTELGMKPR